MQFLDSNQSADIMQRFPTFELSYEIVSHKKVGNEYNVCLAIPYGKKAFIWMTYFQDTDVCFLMEIGRDKKIGRIQIISKPESIPCNLAYGTLLYGTIYKDEETSNIAFVVEDFLFYCGISITKLTFSEKLGFLETFFINFSKILSKSIDIKFALPVMWNIKQNMPPQWSNNIYNIHHFQYRSLERIVPYMNIKHKSEDIASIASTMTIQNTNPTFDIFIPPSTPQYDFHKPQYKESAFFEIRADNYVDIYHLYAFSNTSQTNNRAYYGLAYIPNYKTSVFMNDIFRNIKENRNLDYIEESDDEDDFQDIRTDKYVDLNKRVVMECVFQPKFKRWIPIRLANSQNRIVPIHKLVRTYGNRQ